MTGAIRFIYGDRCGCFLTALLWLVAPLSVALEPSRALTQTLHRIWQLQQGLPQATIYRIRQSSDGYLWLATQTGLVRFDGVRFTSIDDLNGMSLSNVWIHDITEDAQYNLWIATEGHGVIRWHAGEAKRFDRGNGMPSDIVYAAVPGSSGEMWFCTSAGMARYFDGTVVPVGPMRGDVRAACLAADGSIWFGGADASLYVGKNNTFQHVQLHALPGSAAVLSLLSGSDGVIWVGTTAGLVRIDHGQEKLITTGDGLAGDTVYCLERGRDDCIWAGTQNGFTRLRGSELDSFRSADGLSQSTVYTLCEDREGSIWAGTKHGLDQFLDRRTVPFTTTEGLASNDTGPVIGDRATVWVGTIGSGLSRFDGRRFTTLTTAQGLASDKVQALATDGTGDVWVGSESGLTHLHDDKPVRVFTTADGLPSNLILCLTVARDSLWIGTDHGAAILRDNKLSRIGKDERVQAIFSRRDGSVLASAGNGELRQFQDASFEPVDAVRSLTHIDCFDEEADGTLWIGTRGGGLAMLRDSKLTVFRVRDGLYDDDLYGLVGDGLDRLWMACSKGIFYVSRSSLRSFAAGKVSTLTCTPFSPTDALRTIECKANVQPAACRTENGTLWFSTIHGAIEIDPTHLQRKSPPPPVLIEEVILNGKTEQPVAINTLSPGMNNLEFRYTALSFISPTRTTFRYKLEGFDKDWVDAGARREAFYTNLPPGKFRFRVMAMVTDGSSAEAINSVAFRLPPHFYQRAIFIPLLIVLCGSLVWLAYWRRVRLIGAKARAVLAERSRIARELHDTLMQGFSGVTMEMQALAARLPLTEQRGTLEEIIRDSGNCLREARLSVAGLRTDVGPRSGLAQSIAQAAKHITEDRGLKLRMSLDSPPCPLLPEMEYNLLAIVKEAVTNAARHSGCRAIEIAMKCEQNVLQISVKDDGGGIMRPAGSGHYGLIGMKERAAQLGATLDIESSAGRGTTVIVSLPIQKASPDLSSSGVQPLQPRYT